MSLARGPGDRFILRITLGDPDDEQRRLIHPGQTHTLVDPDKHPAIVVEVDHTIWHQVHGLPIAWRIFLPNSQPIQGEWRFDEWCNF